MRRIGALLLSACLLAFLAALSPHLIHHLFEPDRASQDCPLAASAERVPVAPTAPTVVVAPLPQTPGPLAAPGVSRPSLARRAAGARAPPAASA